MGKPVHRGRQAQQGLGLLRWAPLSDGLQDLVEGGRDLSQCLEDEHFRSISKAKAL